MRPIRDQMPLILATDEHDTGLDPGLGDLKQLAAMLALTPGAGVSKRTG